MSSLPIRTRRIRRAAVASTTALLCSIGFVAAAHADNAIQIENKKTVDKNVDNWQPDYDASYQAKNIGIDGTIDGYPSSWSLKNGDTLGLRVSTTAAKFRARIYRLGWYGGVGSRLVWQSGDTASLAGERQAFPAENADTGLVEAKWHDSASVPIPADWVTGQYVVRFTTDTGMEGFTYFTLRDDTAATKGAILFVDSINTANAYNPWPKIVDGSGKVTGGKSLYNYNSGGTVTKAAGDVQAVAVSFDRPHGENWGLGIWRDWTVPMVQWLEQRGYDVAYANSIDMDAGYVFGSRKVWVDAGHDEYWTRGQWDNLESYRDKGLNLAWFSGNDASWQVRYEAGSGGAHSTMVGYKIAAYPDEHRCGTCWNWAGPDGSGGDPEFQLALMAKKAGDTAGQLEHLKNVTYAWAGLKDWDPFADNPSYPGSHGAPLAAPKSIARVQIGLEGLMNGPKLPACPTGAAKDNPCYGITWVVDNSSHWIYAGTGLKDGDRIPLIVGYEMDNLREDATYSSRPPTQVKLAHTDSVFTPDKGSATDFGGKFNAMYYQAKSGAHVFAAGTINWGWGLERPDVGQWGGIDLKTPVGSTTLDQVITKMTVNILDKMITGPGTPPTTYPDGGVIPDGGNPGDDAGTSGGDGGTTGGDASSGGDTAGGPGGPGNPGPATSSSGGCAFQPSDGESSSEVPLALVGIAGASALLIRRRRRS